MGIVGHGVGGVQPGDPNIIERVVDNGDGTATRTTYGPDGQVVEEVTYPHTPDPVLPTVADEVAQLRATVAELLTIIEGT